MMRIKKLMSLKIRSFFKRLVFTSDEVIVVVKIRSVEQYDLVKIKLTESEAEY